MHRRRGPTGIHLIPSILRIFWSGRWRSNPRPVAWEHWGAHDRGRISAEVRCETMQNAKETDANNPEIIRKLIRPAISVLAHRPPRACSRDDDAHRPRSAPSRSWRDSRLLATAGRRLHKPCRCRVAQRVRRHIFELAPRTRVPGLGVTAPISSHYAIEFQIGDVTRLPQVRCEECRHSRWTGAATS